MFCLQDFVVLIVTYHPEWRLRRDTKKTRGIIILALRTMLNLMRPDAEQMEAAITNFMDDMEKQEHGGFTHVHTFLSKLPVPVHT